MRFGMQIPMPRHFDNLTWYGRGPWENYSDRNTSSFIGIWSGNVNDMFFPYIFPQETGNHTVYAGATLTDKSGAGIMVTGMQPLNVSALDVTPPTSTLECVNNRCTQATYAIRAVMYGSMSTSRSAVLRATTAGALNLMPHIGLTQATTPILSSFPR